MFHSDGLITIKRAKSLHTRIGGNYTLAHEDSHYVTAVARSLGVFGDPKDGMEDDGKGGRKLNDRVAVMRKAFGDPTGKNELWNEEAMANAYHDYLRGKYDFHGLDMTHEEKTIFEEIFAAITQFIRSAYRRVFNKDLSPTLWPGARLRSSMTSAWRTIAPSRRRTPRHGSASTCRSTTAPFRSPSRCAPTNPSPTCATP